ncbi:META domain-containing protein [Arsukibacterium sp.]|uniref:META domain-containing protein n=1 Tax=Arsukibacterium sp. TaxID=1977258 RepID=UPI002FDB16D0
MKKSLLAVALLLAGCSQLPAPSSVSPEQLQAPTAVAVPEDIDDVVDNNDTTVAVATNLDHIFIDSDMSFIGTLPCADCPGISYHINLYRDGRFEARQEYLERGQVQLISGIWLLEGRTLHLVNQQQTLPAFHFLNNQQLTMLDLQGRPIDSRFNYQLKRQNEFNKVDPRQALLGLYQLNQNQATFTPCHTGEPLSVANTQHHIPMMRQYQQDEKLRQKPVIATLVGRKNTENGGQAQLLIDKFEQFWPGASCPDRLNPASFQGIVWRAEKLADKYVPYQLNVRLFFDKDKLHGFSGCNSFNASFQQHANRIIVQRLASTRKFCAEGNELELQFTQSLQQADRAEVNGSRLQLFKDNQVIMQFTPALN